MGKRWGAACRAIRARLGRWIAAGAVAAALAAGSAAEVRAEAGWRPLDHHAVVVNRELVGSAFALGDGLLVTNRHVVRGLRPGGTVTLLASGAGGGRAAGQVVAISRRMDLALLRGPAGFVPEVAGEAPAVAGLVVTAAGIDAGRGGTGERLALAGVVLAPSADLPAFGPGLVAWLPGARPGFSGGPLLDDRGRLVGMVTAIRPVEGHAPVATAGGGGGGPAVEVFALRAAEVRAEVERLLAAGR